MSTTLPSIELVKGLKIGYNGPLAAFGETVSLGAGTHFLLARNGRGKTTLLRTIARTLKPVAGNVRTAGFTQFLPEDIRFDPFLSVRGIFRALLPPSRFNEALNLAKRIELDVTKPFGKLSTGNRRKVNLITAEFSVKPATGNILLLDEPFSGLDAFARQAFEELWAASSGDVLRLVSCHPDYDAMNIPSALLIDGENVRHLSGERTWSELKTLLN